MKKKFEEASELDGYEDLNEDDRAKVTKAWVDGHVAEEDIPESAKKPEAEAGDEDDDDDEKPKKKRAPKKKAGDADGEAKEKPKRTRTTKAKVGCLNLPSWRPSIFA